MERAGELLRERWRRLQQECEVFKRSAWRIRSQGVAGSRSLLQRYRVILKGSVNKPAVTVARNLYGDDFISLTIQKELCS